MAIGLTATGARQADTIDAALATGAFDAVQATWNLHERSAGDALGARARAPGMRVVIKEAVANGRLTDRAAPPELAAAARERGVGADAVAIAAALAQPWSDVVLSGASTAAMLDSNLAAATAAAGRRPLPSARGAAPTSTGRRAPSSAGTSYSLVGLCSTAFG